MLPLPTRPDFLSHFWRASTKNSMLKCFRTVSCRGSPDPIYETGAKPDTTSVQKDIRAPLAASSFIERVKALGANALLGAFTSRDGFDQIFQGMEVVRVSSGHVLAVLTVSKKLTNSYNTLHGGATGKF